MVHIQTAVTLACSLVAFASPLGRRSVAQIEADLETISIQVKSLDQAINGIPDAGITVPQGLAIQANVDGLSSALSKGTTDAENTSRPVSEEDGRNVLSDVEAIQPTIIDVLNVIVAKKPALDKFPFGAASPLVKSDLSDLNSAVSAFAAALIAIVPTDLIPRANAIAAAIDAAVRDALAAYNNA